MTMDTAREDARQLAGCLWTLLSVAAMMRASGVQWLEVRARLSHRPMAPTEQYAISECKVVPCSHEGRPGVDTVALADYVIHSQTSVRASQGPRAVSHAVIQKSGLLADLSSISTIAGSCSRSMAHVALAPVAHAPIFASRPDAAHGAQRQLSRHLQPHNRPTACPALARDAQPRGSPQGAHHRPEHPFPAGMRPAAPPARHVTASAARGPGMAAPGSAMERQAPAGSPDQPGTAAGRQAAASGSQSATQALVSTSRRRILSQVGVVGLLGGLCVCCPSIARADEWSYGAVFCV